MPQQTFPLPTQIHSSTKLSPYCKSLGCGGQLALQVLSNMATVCQQCGDRGYYEALIDCEKCQTTAVHLYCLPVLPENFEDDVIWYCEDCEPKVAKPSTTENLEIVQAIQANLRLKKNAVNRLSNSKKKRRDVSSSLAKAEVQKCGNSSSHHLPVHYSETENRDKDQKFRRQKKLDGRSVYEEAESVKRNNSLIAGGDCKSNPLYSCELPCSASDKTYEKLERLIELDGSSSDEEVESFKTRTSRVITNVPLNTPECSSNAHKEPTLEVHCSGNDKKDYQFRSPRELVRDSSDTEIESLKNSVVSTANPLSIPHSSNVCEKSNIEVQCKENDEKDLKVIIWRGSDGGNSIEETEYIKNETSLIATRRPSNIPEHSGYAPAQPIIEPIWKGSLRLSSDKYGAIEGLVAHLSTSACSKVFQEAKLLPQLLCPELLPRYNAWPKSFQKWAPRDDNIALYLFPDNERAEIVYDSLVDDMIGQDVALRAVVKNAELLLFTSNLLPFQFWRFQSKFYLWGVFRAKQASRSQALALYSVNVISLAEPKKPANALTWYPQSPASPLSNSGSYGSGSVHSCQSMI